MNFLFLYIMIKNLRHLEVEFYKYDYLKVEFYKYDYLKIL